MAEVNVKVGMNNSAFSKGLDSMKSQAKTWASDVGKMFVGAFAVSQIIGRLSSLASELDRVGKLATRLGVMPSTIAKIGTAAELAGTSVETVVKAMSKLAMVAATNAEEFEKTGMSAAAFSAADTEEQWLMLAKAYKEAGNNMTKVIAIQKMLGEEGLNLIASLKQGPEALTDSMGEVSKSYDQMVRRTEAFNDAVTKLKKGTVNHMVNIVHAGRQAAAAFNGFFSGKGIMGGLAEFQEQMDREEMAERNAIKKKQAEASEPKISKADRKKAEAEELKAAEELAKLQAEVKDMIAKRNFDALTAEQQLLKLTEEQLAVKAKMRDLNKLSATDLVKLEKEYLELDEKIKAAKEKRDSINEKNKADVESAKKEIRDAIAKVTEEEERQAFEKLSSKEKVDALEQKQAALFDKSDVLGEFGDIKGAAEARLDALKMNDEIDAAKQAVKDEEEDEEEDEDEKMAMPAQVSSSLGAVGGGGGTFVGFDLELAEAKAQTRLLEKIAANTASGQGVTKTNGEFF